MICVDGITEEMINGKNLTECKNIIDSALIDEWQRAWTEIARIRFRTRG